MADVDHPFAVLARAVLPEGTSSRLARMADVNQRIAQRWLSGELEAPVDVVDKLEAQRTALAAFHPGTELAALLATADQHGLDPEVVGAFMAAAYEALLARRIR